MNNRLAKIIRVWFEPLKTCWIIVRNTGAFKEKSATVCLNSRKAEFVVLQVTLTESIYSVLRPSLSLHVYVVMGRTSISQSCLLLHLSLLTFLLLSSFSTLYISTRLTRTWRHVFVSWFRSRAVIQVILTSLNDIGVQFQSRHRRTRDTMGFQFSAHHRSEQCWAHV